MNRNQYLPATRTWVTMLFMAWWVFIAGVSISCAEQPAKLSDEDVIEKSAAAMRPPIQYRMRVANLETTVSQQILANGVLATRTEAVTPGQTIVLCLGGRYFDILPYSEVVIDKTQIEVRPMTAAFVRTNFALRRRKISENRRFASQIPTFPEKINPTPTQPTLMPVPLKWNGPRCPVVVLALGKH